MKPPFPYYGGKTRVAPRIAELLPSHGHYVEPFAGALSVLFAKTPANMETINDKNHHLIHFFTMLRERPEELERACALTPHSRLEHAVARDLDVDDPIERARRVFVLLSQGRNASLRKTGWAHFQNPGRTSNTGSRPAYLQKMIGRFAPIAERLLDVSIECRDGIEMIREYGIHQDVLLYVDPPYLSSTRSSQGYEHEFARETQHQELLEAVLDCTASVILSGYASDLYDDKLSTWHRLALTGGQNGVGGKTTEIIWSNRILAHQPAFEFTVPDRAKQPRTTQMKGTRA